MAHRKASRQSRARLQMLEEALEIQEERQKAKSELKWLRKQLESKNLNVGEMNAIRDEIRSLESTLAQFELDED